MPEFKMVEIAGRTCYKSEAKMDADTDGIDFVTKIHKRKHDAMIEFATMTVRFITDRGISHELVRHRLCSFAQESTRYCNYASDVTFIHPSTWDSWSDKGRESWFSAMLNCESVYQRMIDSGLSPQQARAVLPNSTKTEIVVKANIREWLHIFSLRCAPTAHPDMVALMTPLRDEVFAMYPFLAD
jgi:thymidylate synthase (FAD)